MSWSIDPQPLAATLDKYYRGSSNELILGGDLVTIEKAQLEKKYEKGPVSNSLYQYLAGKEARIRVSAGSYRGAEETSVASQEAASKEPMKEKTPAKRLVLNIRSSKGGKCSSTQPYGWRQQDTG